MAPWWSGRWKGHEKCIPSGGEDLLSLDPSAVLWTQGQQPGTQKLTPNISDARTIFCLQVFNDEIDEDGEYVLLIWANLPWTMDEFFGVKFGVMEWNGHIFINPRMIENLQDSKAKATLHEGMQRDWAQIWQEGVTWRSF